MKRHSKKGKIGTIVAIFLLAIIGISSLISSAFLSQKQTTSTKAASPQCPDGICISPTVPDLGTGPENQTGTGESLAFCPDGGLPHLDGFAAGACDYGKESAGNTTYYIDQNSPQCVSCIWTNYSGGFPYGQCHYANNSVCRRSDNVGGCAGVCNAACCSGNSPKVDGEVYDQGNIPGSTNLNSSPDTGGSQPTQVTATEDTTLIGTPICIDGQSVIQNETGDYIVIGTC